MNQRAATERSSINLAVDNIRRWREHPVAMVTEIFGATPDSWQAEELEAFPHHNRICWSTCVSCGKTTLLAWLAWNFLLTRPYPRIGMTAITSRNLRDNLWAEMGKWYSRSPLLQDQFELGAESVHLKAAPKSWFAAARTWSRDADAEVQGMTLAGLHEDYAMAIIDEAGGIPDAVIAAAEGILASGKETKLVIAGNPTHLSGALYRALTNERPLWRVRELSGDPDDKNRASRVSVQWALDMIKKYGRESAWVQTRVFGKPPKGATDALVSLAQFEDAFNRYEVRDTLSTTPRTLGVDVARYGSDETVVYFRAGDVIERREGWFGKSTTWTAGRVKEFAEEWQADTVYVDVIGVGAGVVDQLESLDVPVIGVEAGGRALDAVNELNKRAELNCGLQDRFREGLIAINPVIQRTTTLVAEGSTLKVGFSSSARRKIESKEEYKKRTGESPDDWDSLVLAFADSCSPHEALMNHYRRMSEVVKPLEEVHT